MLETQHSRLGSHSCDCIACVLALWLRQRAHSYSCLSTLSPTLPFSTKRHTLKIDLVEPEQEYASSVAFKVDEEAETLGNRIPTTIDENEKRVCQIPLHSWIRWI